MSRNFSYGEVANVERVEHCTVTIVVTDVADLRMRRGGSEELTSVSDTNN